MGRPSPITPDQKLELVRRYQSGESRNSLAVAFGASRPFVTDLVRASGVAVRGIREACPTRPVNHEAFADPETDAEAAYWIGLLMADGCIGRQTTSRTPVVILGLSAIDRGHVENFKRFLGAEQSVCDVPPGGSYNSAASARFAVTSARLAADLARHGVTPRKTHTAKASDALVSNRHFWRGVVDGDGSLHVSKRKGGLYKSQPVLQLTGSLDLVTQFADFAANVGGAKARPHRDHSVWAVGLTCGPAVRVIDHLYSDCSVALPRKLAIAREILAAVTPPLPSGASPPPGPRRP